MYVLNNGTPNISGINLTDGKLIALTDSIRPLSGAGADLAQISFTPGGGALIVTERGTNSISSYVLDQRGYAQGPTTIKSFGQTPYGFGLTKDRSLIVSEAFGGSIGAAAASSYAVSVAGELTMVSGSMGDTRSEVCWGALTKDDRFAYVTNFGDGTVSCYEITGDGSLTLHDPVAGSTGQGEKGLRDEAISGDGRYLYAIDARRAATVRLGRGPRRPPHPGWRVQWPPRHRCRTGRQLMDGLVTRRAPAPVPQAVKAFSRRLPGRCWARHLGSIVVMVPGDSGLEQTPVAAAGLDAESAEWLRVLTGAGPRQEAALARLHAMLVRIARGEVRRRGPQLQLTGPELDDLAYQAAADALIAIIGKLGQFRGESRFTTWAYKFVIFEVSAKIGRHFWRHPSVALDAEDWDRLPGRFGFDPAQEAEWRDLLAALHRAVDEELTARQRRIFVAIVLNNVPLDSLVIEMASSRNAIYKALFDARRKLRAALATNGYLPDDRSRRS